MHLRNGIGGEDDVRIDSSEALCLLMGLHLDIPSDQSDGQDQADDAVANYGDFQWLVIEEHTRHFIYVDGVSLEK